MVLTWAQHHHLKEYSTSCTVDEVIIFQIFAEHLNGLGVGSAQIRQWRNIAASGQRKHLPPDRNSAQHRLTGVIVSA